MEEEAPDVSDRTEAEEKSFTHLDLGFKYLNLCFLLNNTVAVQGTIEREKGKKKRQVHNGFFLRILEKML